MGMFGNRGAPVIASDQTDMQPASAWHPTGMQRAAGIIGDALAGLNGKDGAYASQLLQQRRIDYQNAAETARQLAVARFKAANPEDPALIRSLQAAGIDPNSEDGRTIIRGNLLAPHYITLGNPDTGQTVINPGAMPGGMPAAAAAGPQVGAVEGGYVFMGGDPSQASSWRKQ